ncbi:hypothetical protein CDCA_CDCA07G2107 [Cyanidium caldarium]|uniref:Uncharacterized monothiol glutaredoxin ycf64 n=1 Tax=Cyanidium caldarium TaxID=2771 RepID=A0AAV9IUS5_CYACA|nr:hypothetical protein CDCA_CDCA07G2107 [Cyanidium caldarium]
MTQGGSFSSAANAGGSASDESDADFRTVRKAPPSATSMDAVLERIKKDVAAHKVVLYMKGEPKAPLCGFSYKAVVILNSAGVPYKTFNVLADPALREGIKKFSQWPTIPQLFIDGEFVGGSDIMEKMHESGELTKLFADAGL